MPRKKRQPTDEMLIPGGLAFDEMAAFPNLADYECPNCGRIAFCDACIARELAASEAAA